MEDKNTGERLTVGIYREWSDSVTDSPGIFATLSEGVDFVAIDDDSQVPEIVFDSRALILGILVVGKSQSENQALKDTAGWFFNWMTARGHREAITYAIGPTSMTPSTEIQQGLQREFNVRLSRTLQTLSPTIRQAAGLTVKRDRGDLRHIIAALLLSGVLSDKLAEHLTINLDAADQWDLANGLIDWVMGAPAQGELRESWEELFAPLRPSQPEASDPPPPPELPFNEDDAEVETDRLGRGVLAIVVARRLHAIWRRLNASPKARRTDGRASFVIHLDAPWGGGKTTFANFVARVLDPYGYGDPAAFLTPMYGADANLSSLFAEDPSSRSVAERHHLRPWIVVDFNAWRMQHCTPPWWSFYQVVRKACFTAIRARGHRPADPASKGRPPRQNLLVKAGNLAAWLYLILRETMWRLSTPALVLPLITLAGTTLALLLLDQFGILTTDAAKNSVSANVQTYLGWTLAASASLTVVGGAMSLFVRSLAPGLDPLAEGLGLGRADPLERFRRHFHTTMARIKRPVLVVVDDLDRCSPEAIVDLVRGMQTILRSPRVVFMVLGDREWIERAFESQHKDFAAVGGGGGEQTVGARFVEKAVQMSFILPGMEPENQKTYVSELLTAAGRRDTASADKAEARLREQIRREAANRPGSAFDPEALRESARNDWESAKAYMEEAKSLIREAWTASSVTGTDEQLEAAARNQVNQIVNEVVAIQAAAAPEVEAETARRLLPLAPWLPRNPRQIKRILNGIAVYQAAALSHPTFKMGGDRWFQLAIWIVIMTEWPSTFRLLSACPELANVLASQNPRVALARVDSSTWPGSEEAILKEINRIRSNHDLRALITGKGRDGEPRLDALAIQDLLVLTPPQFKLRLAETPSVKAEAAA